MKPIRILYHGSNSDFKQFKIDESLVKHDIQTVLPEGVGVYMSHNRDFVKNYGKIIYIIEPLKILDFTKKSNIRKIIKDFLNKFDTEKIIINNLNINQLNNSIEMAYNGDMAIMKLLKELWMLSEENMYLNNNYEIDLYDYYDRLEEKYFNFLKSGVIAYNDKNIGIIYISKDINNFKLIKKELI
jgi:hypothetical protein